MTLTNYLSRLMALFNPPKERRKNRESGLTPSRVVIDNARMHRALVEISNITQSRMNDAQFRVHAQDLAHTIIEDIGRWNK